VVRWGTASQSALCSLILDDIRSKGVLFEAGQVCQVDDVCEVREVDEVKFAKFTKLRNLINLSEQ
jgi:hypothetical protein